MWDSDTSTGFHRDESGGDDCDAGTRSAGPAAEEDPT
jgi:hypothetical protein